MNNPTPQALKAAEVLVYAYRVGPYVERVAASIDHDTKLPELLAVVEAARGAMSVVKTMGAVYEHTISAKALADALSKLDAAK